MVNEDYYGGFIVSKNICSGVPIRYSFREKSSIRELNGWTLYSGKDDQEYISNPKNFTILGITSICHIAPVMLEIYEAPYGTDLCWLYEQGVHIGFYDLKGEREISIAEIVEVESQE